VHADTQGTNLTISAVDDTDAVAPLADLADAGILVGVPVHVKASKPGTYTLERSFPSPLPGGAAATWGYFDTDLGGWVPVPSSLSADRRTLTASVDHLSIWDSFVSAAAGAYDAVKNAVVSTGSTAVDIGTSVANGVSKAADWAASSFTKGIDSIGYHVDSAITVRVSAPTCTGDVPAWVSQVVQIEPDRNDPILWCVGRDNANPNLLVVKARANRGFGYGYSTAVDPAWEYNSTTEHSAIGDLLDAAGDLGGTFASSVDSLTFGAHLVGPGEEVSFGFDETTVREQLETGTPLVTLQVPNTVQFLFTVLARLVAQQAEDLTDGPVGMLLAFASCASGIGNAGSLDSTVGAVITCIRSQDEAVAMAIARSAGGSAKDPKALGKAIGAWVGRAAIYLALIGPIQDTLDFIAAKNTPDAARHISIYPTTLVATKTITVNPFEADGTLRAGWTVTPAEVDDVTDCGWGEPAVGGVSENTYWCADGYLSAIACWAPIKQPGQADCLYSNPVNKQLFSIPTTGMNGTQPTTDPDPIYMQLDDGSEWVARSGGSWGGRSDGYAGAYACVDHCVDQVTVVLVQPGEEVVDRSSTQWTVLTGPLGEPDDDFPAPTVQAVRKAWFVASTMPNP